MELNFSQKEKEILDFWKKEKIIEKNLEKNKKRDNFVFYEGPPTANGRPGLHHVLARSFKDLFCKFWVMKGKYVRRKAGWDTHGLPVEIEIEKRYGFQTKKEIEKYGIGKFNKECKESVFFYKKEWEILTERIGFFLDQKNPYITCSNDYLETLFFIIKKFFEKGILKKEKKIFATCPRCQTSLSSHEVALGYKKEKISAIFVKFKKKDEKNTFFLAWTTTPWTLTANIFLAINPKEKYFKVKFKDEIFILAEKRARFVFGEKFEVVDEFFGKEIVGEKYEPLFEVEIKNKKNAFLVVEGDFVTMEEGTGIVHIAPAFGEDDFNLWQKIEKEKRPEIPITVDEEGKMKKGVIGEGKSFRSAEKDIKKYLKKKNLLFKEELYEHTYPFCWRCSSPLFYYLQPSWVLKTKKFKDVLIKENQKINWVPSHLKEGRFGEWLKELKDWNFSRKRFWGTPLPIWRCEKCKKYLALGSKEDFKKQIFSKNRYFILRHAECVYNQKKILNFENKNKYPLTKKGKKEAKLSAKRLKKLLKGKKIDLIFSSPFLRCKETAEIVAEEIGFKKEIILDERLKEINLGKKWEGKPKKEFEKKFLDYPQKLFEKAPEGGESWLEVKKRMLDFLEEIEKKYQGKNILIVSHGDPLWMLWGAMEGWEKEDYFKKGKKRDYIKKAELRELTFRCFPYNEKGELDFHRPYIDKVKFFCPFCKKGEMIREKDVVDCWFDSGAMPFAQDHWPFSQKETLPPKYFPADFICEGIDQTRGWFYTLHAVSCLLGFGRSFKNVIALGHVLDKEGQKMSKSKGNVVDPWEMIEKYGADVLRWYFFVKSHPGDPKRFDEKDLKEIYRKFFNVVLNCLKFYKEFEPKRTKNNFSTKEVLNQWILSRTQFLIKKVEKFLENFQATEAAREIENFVIEDLSRWYIRVSKEKFYQKKKEYLLTLREVLLSLAKILAPFLPFLAETLWQEIQKKGSVHLENFPKIKKRLLKEKIEKEMEKTREIVSLGLKRRKEAQIKVRQPLAELKIFGVSLKKDFVEIIKKELNVKKVSFEKGKFDVFLDTKITPELKKEGIFREILRQVQDMRKRLSLKKENKIKVFFEAPEEIKKVIKDFEKNLKKRAIIEKIESKKPKKFSLLRKIKIDKKEVSIYIL